MCTSDSARNRCTSIRFRLVDVSYRQHLTLGGRSSAANRGRIESCRGVERKLPSPELLRLCLLLRMVLGIDGYRLMLW